MRLHRIPKRNYWVHLLPQIRRQDLCCQEWIEKEFLLKEVSGRKVELDEVLPLEPESGATQENVPKVPAPIREEVNENDQDTSDQAPTEIRRSTRTRSALEWYGNPVLEIMLLDNGEPSNYEEAMRARIRTNCLKP